MCFIKYYILTFWDNANGLITKNEMTEKHVPSSHVIICHFDILDIIFSYRPGRLYFVLV